MSPTTALGGSEPLRSHAIALYSFLKEFTELRTKTIRTIDQYDQILWFSDVPRNMDKLCDCAVWHRGEDLGSGGVWLEIRQPQLSPVPEPPAELKLWLILEQVGNSSLEMLELRDEIAFPIQNETGDTQFERRQIENHPDIKLAWEQYIEMEWRPWAEADRKNQSVQKVYTSLFSIYQKQQRLGEQYEVVLGMGLLVWKTPDGHEVCRHLVTANTDLGFDATRGIMTVGPAGEGAKVVIEQDMLDPKVRPNPEELRVLEGQIAEVGDQVWDPTPVDAILGGWVHAASPKGIYRNDLSPPKIFLSDPQVNLAPALILRKRTEKSFIRAFDEIINQLQNGASIPTGVARFVTKAEDTRHDEEPERASQTHRTDSDLYFPLESNEAQQRIVERLRSHDGVLVQGPPGTGKSHTIVNLICHLLAEGQRVLVTSHTARALKVLQRYIRERTEEISPLAVVLLGDDRVAMQAMEDSVQGITSRQNSWDSEVSRQELRRLGDQLDESRREEAQVLEELRSIRERETYSNQPRFGGYEGTLQAIATRVGFEKEKFGWLKDRPNEEQEPPLTTAEFRELITLLEDSEIEEWGSAGWKSLSMGELIKPDAFSSLVTRASQSKTAYESFEESRRCSEYPSLIAAPPESRKRLQEELSNLITAIDLISRRPHGWTEKAVFQILGDQDRGWRELFEKTKRHLTVIGRKARWADETTITGLGGRDLYEVRVNADDLFRHLARGGWWGVWPFRAQAAKRGLYLRDEVKIAGQQCQAPENLKDLIAWLDVKERLRLLQEAWMPYCSIDSVGFAAKAREFEALCEPLEAALDLHERVARIRALIQTIPGFPEPTWHELASLRKTLVCLAAIQNEEQLHEINEDFLLARNKISFQVEIENLDPIGKHLLLTFQERDEDGYRIAFSQAVQNEQKTKNLGHRDDLLERLQKGSPLLAKELSSDPGKDSLAPRASQFLGAWNWARTVAWLERLSDPATEQQLRTQLDSIRDRIRNRLKDIAAGKAWAHCFSRMTLHEQEHLIAWSKAVRSIGKGQGKYVARHRKNAREHMNECRSAIPAWVMPLYRVAETIKPGTDLFDVVIVDEASQSGPEALLLSYLAKKLVVVGDDKQISPTYAGINHEDVNQIRARYIAALPHSDSYGVEQSFFDLAEIRYRGRIRLREHFRCMPDIIQFSNNLCYQSEPLIPLREYGCGHLSPVVSARHVRDGYLRKGDKEKVNPPEAQAIVNEIIKMNGDSRYKGKTFGVISLLGDSQAKEVEAILLKQLGPREMENRQLVCGDAYAFQGDERDIMFLSMVSAPSESRKIGTLTKEDAKRRFNVAASRARDQLMLFHTATLNDLSPQCFRYELLQYCLHPSVEGAKVSGVLISDLQHQATSVARDRIRPPEPFESWFEVDVFLKLAARGYRVLPQYEKGGYRIDLLVEGMNGRLAVECDGDHWHGPEQYEADMTRERMLSRSGLQFWRVRGSTFYLDKDGALEGLWKTLERVGVYPVGHGGPVEKNWSTHPKTTSPVPEQPESGKNTIESTRGNLKDRKNLALDHKDMVEDKKEDPQPQFTRSEFSKREIDPLTVSQRGHEEGAKESRFKSLELDSNILCDFSGYQAPYANWRSQSLPDPLTAKVDQIIEGLSAIISVEGPIVCYRAYFIYARAVNPPILRVGRQIRSIFNKAISKGIQRGIFEGRDEHRSRDVFQHIVRKKGTNPIVVRKGGNRLIEEIPPAELGAVMIYLWKQDPNLAGDQLFRATAERFDIKRMTSDIRERLSKIMERYIS